VAAAGAAAAQAAAPGPGDVAAVPGTAPPHPLVLLVDDDAPLRETLALVLEDAGYRVVQATDGRAALALLATGPAIDALVTDLSMPGLDGVAVIRAAQARCPGLPAVLLTGYAGDGTMRGGTMIEGAGTCSAGAGTYALLCKPVTAPQLADCLGALLGMRPEAAPSRAPLRAKQSAAESQAERRWNLSGASLGPEWSAPRELRGALA
jgi:CheY-like chemotaxis protein